MRKSSCALFVFIVASAVISPISANAAPNLIEVQGRVRDLQEQATTAAEGAQEAKVQLSKLKKKNLRYSSAGSKSTRCFS